MPPVHVSWPVPIALLARLARPGDRGVGDTFARVLGPPGERFKEWYRKATGHECGCEGRLEALNERYPYL